MKKRSRGIWVVLFGLPLLLILPVARLGSAMVHTGTIDVRVTEKGEDGTSIGARIPAIVVPIAFHIAPDDILDEIRCEMGGEAAWTLDVVRAAVDELSGVPDCTLVEVRTPTEIVTVEIRSGKMEVQVDTPDEAITASVPLRSLSAFANAI